MTKKPTMHLTDLRYNGIFGYHSYCGRYVGQAGMVATMEELEGRKACQVCLARRREVEEKWERAARRLGLYEY